MKRIKRFIILAMKKKFRIKSPSRLINGTPCADERTYRELWRLAKKVNKGGRRMNYIDLASRYYSLTQQIGFLEKQIERDNDLALVRELAFLRGEQKRVAEKIDEYNARYETETWGVD